MIVLYRLFIFCNESAMLLHVSVCQPNHVCLFLNVFSLDTIIYTCRYAGSWNKQAWSIFSASIRFKSIVSIRQKLTSMGCFFYSYLILFLQAGLFCYAEVTSWYQVVGRSSPADKLCRVRSSGWRWRVASYYRVVQTRSYCLPIAALPLGPADDAYTLYTQRIATSWAPMAFNCMENKLRG
jgi:hypothetical protein